ncbi:MAG: nucleotidyltransferase domain-containing protein [Desulfurococcaceae archaeon]|jgi:predicted nucleotidyltransferase
MGKAKSAVESQREALRKALEFVREVRVRLRDYGFTVREAYIVGSRARGDYTDESDVDIALVVDGVEELNILERLSLIKDLMKPKIDVRVYSTKEWYSESSAWIRELRKEAKPLPMEN